MSFNDERDNRLETATTGASEGVTDSIMLAAMLERLAMKRRVRLRWIEEGKGSGKQRLRTKWLGVIWGLQQLFRSSADSEISGGWQRRQAMGDEEGLREH
ncbi:hypothetical protein BHM03_00022170 [Ensete ventricosum]|nr:hypothetical protein BHM03_00022170 [Ensete ventricosum]